jgi:hypothetical protein
MIRTFLRYPLKWFFGTAGILFILLSMFSVQDITKLQVTFVSPVRFAPLITGVVFILLSLIWHVAPYLSIPLSWTALVNVKATPVGFQTTIAHASVEICFGKIQTLCDMRQKDLVVLPANDLFDDDCIHDTRSALGSFVNHMFPNQVHEICAQTSEKLKNIPKTETGGTHRRFFKYEIGTTVFFDQPLRKNLKMAFVASTSVIDGEGIRCDAPSIFNAIKGVHKLMNQYRIDAVVLPVIGSGHGGLRPPISLICMLIAFGETLRQPSGRHIKRVRIVVYQKDERTKPVISRWEVRRFMAFAQRYC